MTLTSDVNQRKQRSQHNRPNPNSSYKTKKNFTGFYTEVNLSSYMLKEHKDFTPHGSKTKKQNSNLRVPLEQ